MKWLMYLILTGLIASAWIYFSKTGSDIKAKQDLVNEIYEIGDPDGKAGKLNEEIQGLEGTKTFNGILLAILSAALFGVVAVVDVLPAFAQRITHAVYDSAEMLEHDAMHDARSLLAQGDFEGAIASFRKAAVADPLNRLPWVEIAKIYKNNLHDPASAIQTIRDAIESHEWEVNDAAYFLFRLAELYDEVEGNRASAVAIMHQVVDQFAGTRHAANAAHKLHEWVAENEAHEEQEYLAKISRSSNAETARQSGTVHELPPNERDEDPRNSI